MSGVSKPVGLALALAVLAGHIYLLDGIHGWLWSFGFQEDTEYASGYTDQAFRRLTLGMTPTQVLQRLGQPLEEAERDETKVLWRYTRSPGDKSYRVRALLFEHGRLVEIYHEFYVD